MLIIDSPDAMDRALHEPLEPDLRRLLKIRREQNMNRADDADGSPCFYIVESTDRLEAIESALGFPLLLDGQPSWEWVERHGSLIEIALIFGEAADIVLVRDDDTTDTALIALLHLHAAHDLERQNTAAV